MWILSQRAYNPHRITRWSPTFFDCFQSSFYLTFLHSLLSTPFSSFSSSFLFVRSSFFLFSIPFASFHLIPSKFKSFFSPHRSSFFFFSLFTSVVQLLLPSSESLPFFFFSFFLASFSFFPPPLCYCTALLLLRYIPSSFFFEARKEEKKENRGDFYTRKPSCVPACRKQLKYI